MQMVLTKYANIHLLICLLIEPQEKEKQTMLIDCPSHPARISSQVTVALVRIHYIFHFRVIASVVLNEYYGSYNTKMKKNRVRREDAEADLSLYCLHTLILPSSFDTAFLPDLCL